MLCLTCNQPFKPSRKTRKYCSKACFGASCKKIKSDKICAHCGKTYQPWIYRAESSKFCSQICKKAVKGSSHPIYGSRNKRWSYVHARRLLPQVCKICGMVPTKEKRLEVHHIDTNWENTDISNFCMLCVSCHRKVHFLLKHGFDFTEAVDRFHDYHEITRHWVKKIRRALA